MFPVDVALCCWCEWGCVFAMICIMVPWAKIFLKYNLWKAVCIRNTPDVHKVWEPQQFKSFILLSLLPPVKFVIPWGGVTRLERVSTSLMTEAIRVTTRQRQREFSMFLNLDETFRLICQLADVALRRLLDSEGLELDRVLQQPTRINKRSVLVLVSVTEAFLQSLVCLVTQRVRGGTRAFTTSLIWQTTSEEAN